MTDQNEAINDFCQQQSTALIYLIIYIRACKHMPLSWRSVQKHQYLYSWERKAWRCTASCCTGKLFVEWRLNYFICLTVKLHTGNETYSNAKHEVTVWWNKFCFLRGFFFSYKTLFYYMRGRESSANCIIPCKSHCKALFLTINLRVSTPIESSVWIDSIRHRNSNN